jgi:hypothetical protein
MKDISMMILLLLALAADNLSKPCQSDGSDIGREKNWLISDLKSLEGEAAKLDKALSRASVKAEIADAAWSLDKEWAQNLLREAYELTLPGEEERNRLRSQPVGSAPKEPDETALARMRIRNRVLNIASRDSAFAGQLAQLGKELMGKMEEAQMHSSLAAKSIVSNDLEAAGKYILSSVEAEPTQIGAGWNIYEVAARDREAADDLIIKYIERLQSIPLSADSAARTYLSLRFAVFPNPYIDPKAKQAQPAGSRAVRAYLHYVIESMAQLEQREPGSAIRLRPALLSLWQPLQQHAPEMTARFLEMEQASRRPGEKLVLPTVNSDEKNRLDYEERLRKAADTREKDDVVAALRNAMGRKDYTQCRRLLDFLSESDLKTSLVEEVNLRESISLAQQGEVLTSRQMAYKLNTPEAILKAYPEIIRACVDKKYSYDAITLVQEAVRKLKGAGERDDLPRIFSQLAISIAPLDSALALDVLEETVYAANRSHIDTGNGYAGFNINVFYSLVAKDENRVLDAANILKDRVRWIMAKAAILRWKAERLKDSAPTKRQEPKKDGSRQRE